MKIKEITNLQACYNMLKIILNKESYFWKLKSYKLSYCLKLKIITLNLNLVYLIYFYYNTSRFNYCKTKLKKFSLCSNDDI